mmetsp:Transcript_36018/g.84095  ORF Transcript_36018/g.84095 Transcript_36018/m.84095 type:complete len:106 (+) Transcript_36018:1092-1409(+)
MREVHFNREKDRRGKLAYKFGGPCSIADELDGGSYHIKNLKFNAIVKKCSSGGLLVFTTLSAIEEIYMRMDQILKPNKFIGGDTGDPTQPFIITVICYYKIIISR